jgi:hypothetical protein
MGLLLYIILALCKKKLACLPIVYCVRMIANPPIIFGETAQLVCAPVTPNISYNINNVTAWLGGKDYSILIYNGGNAV